VPRKRPRIRRQHIVDKQVSYPGATGDDFTWEAPTDHFILDHRIEVHGYGRYGANVKEVKAASSDSIEETKINELNQAFQRLQAAAEALGRAGSYKAELEGLQKRYLDYYKRVRASHSRIVVHWDVKAGGNDFDRKGGAINGTLLLQVARVKPLDVKELESRIKAGKQLFAGKYEHSAQYNKEQLCQAFGYAKNGRLTAQKQRIEPQEGHANWARGQTEETVERALHEELDVILKQIDALGPRELADVLGYVKNCWLLTCGKNPEPQEGHVNWALHAPVDVVKQEIRRLAALARENSGG
jgi:hypothetical protein